MKMKYLNYLFLSIITAVLLTSCGSINNTPFAKRKYTSGIFLNKKEDVAVNEKQINNLSNTTKPQTEEIEFNKKELEYQLPNTTKNEVSTNENKVDDIAISNFKHENKLKKGFNKAKNIVLPSITLNKASNAKAPQSHNNSEDDKTMLLIKVILAIVLPPLAVFVHEKITTDFWIDLILWLFFGVGRFSPFFFGFWGIAIIYALLVVFDIINMG